MCHRRAITCKILTVIRSVARHLDCRIISMFITYNYDYIFEYLLFITRVREKTHARLAEHLYDVGNEFNKVNNTGARNYHTV